MRKYSLLIFSSLIFSLNIFSQALPIALDGLYIDWLGSTSNYTDAQGDGASIDMLSFSAANDSSFLYLKFELNDEIRLNSGNNLVLEIDTDNDSTTGYSINGIGAELGWLFGSKFGYFNSPGSTTTVDQADILFRALPTVTSNSFEIAISRNVLPDNVHPLFTGDTIKICFYDQTTNGDYMPDEGSQFTYVFDNTSLPAYDAIDINKSDTNFVRLMTYNTLFNGLIDPQRAPAFGRIITAVNPDIITFNECWDTQWYEARNFLDNYLPLANGNQWQCWKIDGANITCSRFPITQNWQILPDRRLTASLIDLPTKYARDILVVNAHFKCCDGDSIRQREADGFASFIKDAKTSGGVIDLSPETPFLISGDLNLVGYSQQLTTLITGDIQDTAQFGSPAALDWDNTDLNDVIALQTDNRMAYTWRDDGSSYWPGRLDYCIASDVNLNIEKAFTIQTEVMPAARLSLYGLQQNDTHTASDHFPKVTDFSIPLVLGTHSATEQEMKIDITPNPAKENIKLNIKNAIGENKVEIVNPKGEIVYSNSFYGNEHTIDTSELAPSVYFVKFWNKNFEKTEKIILVN